METEEADISSEMDERSSSVDCSLCSSPVIRMVNLLIVRGKANVGPEGALALYRVIDSRLGKEVSGSGVSWKLWFISRCIMGGVRTNSRRRAPCCIFASRLPVIMNLCSLGNGGKENGNKFSALERSVSWSASRFGARCAKRALTILA